MSFISNYAFFFCPFQVSQNAPQYPTVPLLHIASSSPRSVCLCVVASTLLGL